MDGVQDEIQWVSGRLCARQHSRHSRPSPEPVVFGARAGIGLNSRSLIVIDPSEVRGQLRLVIDVHSNFVSHRYPPWSIASAAIAGDTPNSSVSMSTGGRSA